MTTSVTKGHTGTWGLKKNNFISVPGTIFYIKCRHCNYKRTFLYHSPGPVQKIQNPIKKQVHSFPPLTSSGAKKLAYLLAAGALRPLLVSVHVGLLILHTTTIPWMTRSKISTNWPLKYEERKK